MPVDEATLRAINRIEGWFSPLDARVFVEVGVHQDRAGTTGDLLEIGVFQGRSAVLLGFLRRGDERLVACDLFERQRQRQRFEANWRQFHGPLPEVHAGPSSALATAGLGRTFRLAHVDGGHDFDVVQGDVALVRDLLVPGGVAIFDDVCAPQWPGVAAAVWEAVAVGGLVPVCLTDNKLVAAWERLPALQSTLEAWATDRDDVDLERHRVQGHDVLRLSSRARPRSVRQRVAHLVGR